MTVIGETFRLVGNQAGKAWPRFKRAAFRAKQWLLLKKVSMEIVRLACVSPHMEARSEAISFFSLAFAFAQTPPTQLNNAYGRLLD